MLTELGVFNVNNKKAESSKKIFDKKNAQFEKRNMTMIFAKRKGI